MNHSMRRVIKRVFAMILALMLTVPTVVWPEEALDASGAVILEDGAPDEDLFSEDTGLSVEEPGDLVLEELEVEEESGQDEEIPVDPSSFDTPLVEEFEQPTDAEAAVEVAVEEAVEVAVEEGVEEGEEEIAEDALPEDEEQPESEELPEDEEYPDDETEEEIIAESDIDEEIIAESDFEEETASEENLDLAKAPEKVSSVSFVKRSWNETDQTVDSQTETEYDVDAVPGDGSMTQGWYYLNSNVTVKDRVKLTGDTWLILGDGCTLDVKGLYIPQGSTLTIYGQAKNTGTLYSHPSDGSAIGAYSGHKGGNVVIHGGTIQAEGHKNCAGIGGNDGNEKAIGSFTMYSGEVIATGGESGAGIGGGRGCEGGEITIYGGMITAKGGHYGAGIGGGNGQGTKPMKGGHAGTISIYGGEINAAGGDDAAGIGGGEGGNAGTITINGGSIVAYGGENGAGIGGGEGESTGTGGSLTINGGEIYATGGDNGASIGGGEDGNCTITINGGTVYALESGENGAGIGGGNNADGGNITINGGDIWAYHRDGAGIGGGEGGNGGTINITDGNITVYCVNGSEGNGAAIGGGNSANGGDITIGGGLIYTYHKNGAGIGGGSGSNGGTILINSGQIFCEPDTEGKGMGAGIGGGKNGGGGSITFTGGEVYATSGELFAIGAGAKDKSAGFINIKGNAVVRGYGNQAGFGGKDGELRISGNADVVASGNGSTGYGYGIWFDSSDDAAINVNGGKLIAAALDDKPTDSTKYSAIRSKGNVVFTGGMIVTENLTGNSAGCFDVKAILYTNGTKITAGSKYASATELNFNERDTIFTSKNYPYVRIEPCDHQGTVHEGLCSACGYRDGTITYLERSWNGTEVESISKDMPADTAPFPTNLKEDSTLSGGWYYLSKSVTVNGRISFTDDTNLILCDGCTLDVKGLHIPLNKTLTIYGQSDDTGKIISHPSAGAAIGGYSGNLGGSIIVHGGVIQATGHDHCAGIGSNDGQGGNTGSFTMYGGEVTATGGSYGAGIGGGRDCGGGTITIYGGIVTATGKDSSAGIGSGDPSDSQHYNSIITIYGGTVTATGNSKGAGIGGGEYGHATINIYDGTVTATGGKSGGAGIGSGVDGDASSVKISGGVVKATATSGGCGIGNGKGSSASAITLDYTDTTQDSISITTTGFGGTVNLLQPFYNGHGLFQSGGQEDLDLLVDSTLKAWDGESVVTWVQLRGLINTAPDGETITLEQDYTAQPGDLALEISGKSLTIDLNGHKLNRNQDDPAEDCPAIIVAEGASLTIEDKGVGGTILGGYAKNGGGIYCEGTLTLNGGIIRGNNATEFGGGVYLADNTGAVLNLNGGQIRNNYSGTNGGGVYVSKSAKMTVSGEAVVKNNKQSSGYEAFYNNVTLAGDAVIEVAGVLSEDAYISVNKSDKGVATSGYRKYHTEEMDIPGNYFHSDDSSLGVVLRNSEGWIEEPAENTYYVSYEWADDHLKRTRYQTGTNWMSFPEEKNIPGGMYVVDHDISVNGRVTLQDDTWLLLKNENTLNVKGLYIPEGKTLTIYGQNNDYGGLVSKSDEGAAIGAASDKRYGGDIIIHGGVIQAVGHDNCAGIGSNSGDGKNVGNITIYGGKITASSRSNGAGIGAGRNSDGGTIKIYGGTITATGADSSAGIGGGDASDKYADFSTIEIYSGTITAKGNSKGAGIGGGEYGHADITISGGKITATGGKSGGAGIGDGANGSGSTITMNYTDRSKDAISIKANSYTAPVTFQKDFQADSSYIAAGTFAQTSVLADKTLTASGKTPVKVKYRDLNNKTQTEKCFIVSEKDTFWSDNWYAVTSSFSIDKEVCVVGDVNLILADDCKVNTKNIKVPAGNSLTIWGQSDGSGTLTATADNGGKAGIGGSNSDCGTITINGGTVTAKGVSGGAGIGACMNNRPGTVIINGGTVTANGGDGGAGIGGGSINTYDKNVNVNEGRVKINGGTVKAYGQNGGAGIGSGCHDTKKSQTEFDTVGTILITGGNITARGSECYEFTKDPDSDYGMYHVFSGYGAAIGGGYCCKAGDITITGGTVNAEGIENGAGIGTGSGSEAKKTTVNGGTITISGGTVNASSSYDSYGAHVGTNPIGATIGGSFRGGGVTITITGGVVNATAGRNGKNIGTSFGSGKYGSASSTTLDWTDESKRTMIVNPTGSYNCNLHFDSPFTDEENEEIYIVAITESELKALAGKKLRPWYRIVDCTVTFLPGDSSATGTMRAETVEGETYYSMPDCDFVVEGKSFRAWSVKIGNSVPEIVPAGKQIYVRADATATALWREDAGVAIEDGDKTVYVGETDVNLSATVANAGTNGEWTWTSSDEDVALVDNTGAVTLVKPGTATITAKYVSDETCGEAEITLTVGPEQPSFTTHSLLLSGSIGINFFMKLPELSDVDYEDSYMEFRVNDRTTTDPFDAGHMDQNGRGYYGFTVYVTSVEMAEPITAIFHYGDDKTVTNTYSVKDYILAYEEVQDQFDSATTNLVHAIADYGHYVQPVLARNNNWTIGKEYQEMDKYYTGSFDYDAVASKVAGYARKADIGDSGFSKIMFTLNLLSRTQLRIYFYFEKNPPGNISTTIDGVSVNPVKQSTRYYVDTPTLSAHQLSKTYTVVVTTDTGTATMEVSPLSYINTFIGPDNKTDNRDAVSAIYHYYAAAQEYSSTH